MLYKYMNIEAPKAIKRFSFRLLWFFVLQF